MFLNSNHNITRDITSDIYKNNIFKHYCLQEIQKINVEINIKYNNKKFFVKYTDDYYLSLILKLLNIYNTWSHLIYDKTYINKSKYHYKTIYNKFILWSSHNVFENAFRNFNINYSNNNHTNTIIIDTTLINNLYGSDNVALNRTDFKHNVTNLSIISDTNKIIYSTLICPINRKVTEKGFEYFTLQHDVNMLKSHMNDLDYIKNNNSKYYTLLGDKGYITSEKCILHNKPVNIITPIKCNSKKKLSIAQKLKLKKRRKIEHINAILKKNARLNVRKDRSKYSFMNFVYIGSLVNNIKQYINILKDKYTVNTIDKLLTGG